MLVASYYDSLRSMIWTWTSYEENSHGIILPFLCLYLIWQKRTQILQVECRPTWVGTMLFVFALTINLIGRMAAIASLQQYSFVLAIYGLVITYGGWRLFRSILAPLLLLLFMVPLPSFIMTSISAKLQLLSSQLGVFFIRLAGISVFLEGNVIDLGVFQLQVAEACSGLRYLFPLMTMGFVMAYLFRSSFVNRFLVFISSIPLTLLMNSLRIGLIGIMVEYWGISMAEGFLHDFEGWFMFMCSCAVMLLEIRLLSLFGKSRRSWGEVFVLFESPDVAPFDGADRASFAPTLGYKTSAFVFAVSVLSVAATTILSNREEVKPYRASFVEFPQKMDSWQGHRTSMEQFYLDVLKLDDYIISDFVEQDASGVANTVNFYSAWYESQLGGRAAHSPKTCLPGGGWIMQSLEQVEFKDILVSGKPLHVNRSVIVNGSEKQLVYYWFQQRGRTITNEYMVKWYIFWDSLTRQRTDGALIRVIIPLSQGQSVDQAEQVLHRFMRALVPKLEPYIPG